MVQGDQFVGLGSGEAPFAVEQGVEPVPLGAVGRDEDIEVHRVSLLAAPWVGAGSAWQTGGARRGAGGSSAVEREWDAA
ncbi:hypothetical protein San01_72450 [Streptomyces angustmyceticus]|uniref:Uncharacterized protein n=1 Tax=Streptomyces angustmyceticus TaxID=285578 RepID=A0A5J4LKZ8_9ACTN|nr:hypothetical protein San01_72450 [Streptomyces angustmyceticus]